MTNPVSKLSRQEITQALAGELPIPVADAKAIIRWALVFELTFRDRTVTIRRDPILLCSTATGNLAAEMSLGERIVETAIATEAGAVEVELRAKLAASESQRSHLEAEVERLEREGAPITL